MENDKNEKYEITRGVSVEEVVEKEIFPRGKQSKPIDAKHASAKRIISDPSLGRAVHIRSYAEFSNETDIPATTYRGKQKPETPYKKSDTRTVVPDYKMIDPDNDTCDHGKS